MKMSKIVCIQRQYSEASSGGMNQDLSCVFSVEAAPLQFWAEMLYFTALPLSRAGAFEAFCHFKQLRKSDEPKFSI